MISVIIPCFNAARFVAPALESVLAQTYRDLEVICVDDASTDGTAAILVEFARRDSRVRPIRLGTNGGAAHARNVGIEHAGGEWIAPLDADDRFHPDRLRRLLASAVDQDADLVADDIRLLSYPGHEDLGTAIRFLGDEVQVLDIERFLALSTLDAPGYGPGYLKPMLRESFLRNHGLRYDTAWRVPDDFALYLECLAAGARFIVVPEALYDYVQVPQGISRSGTAALDEIAAQCEVLAKRLGGRLSERARFSLETRRLSAYRIARVVELKRAVLECRWTVVARALADPRTFGDTIWFLARRGLRPKAGVPPRHGS